MNFVENGNNPTVEIYDDDDNLIWDNSEHSDIDAKDYQHDYVLFLGIIEFEKSQNPSWRKGQTVFNCLYNLYPELANKIRATELDPFYVDERIPQTLEYVYNKLAERAGATQKKLPAIKRQDTRESSTGGDNDEISRSSSDEKES